MKQNSYTSKCTQLSLEPRVFFYINVTQNPHCRSTRLNSLCWAYAKFSFTLHNKHQILKRWACTESNLSLTCQILDWVPLIQHFKLIRSSGLTIQNRKEREREREERYCYWKSDWTSFHRHNHEVYTGWHNYDKDIKTLFFKTRKTTTCVLTFTVVHWGKDWGGTSCSNTGNSFGCGEIVSISQLNT